MGLDEAPVGVLVAPAGGIEEVALERVDGCGGGGHRYRYDRRARLEVIGPMSFSAFARSKQPDAMLVPSTPVVHLELHTGDLQGARAFYSQLCDWHPDRVDTRHGSYHTLELGGGLGGGIVECATQRPLWLPYVEVSEIGRGHPAGARPRRRRAARGSRRPRRLAQRRRHAGGRRDRLLAGQAMRRPLRRRVLAVCHPKPVAPRCAESHRGRPATPSQCARAARGRARSTRARSRRR